MTKTHVSERLAGGQVLAATLLLGLACLPLGQWLAPQVILYLYALFALRLAALYWPALAPNRWLLLPLTLAGLINVVAAYATVTGREAGGALLATMLALKLLEVRGKRDVRLLAILFGFFLASLFLFDQSPLLLAYVSILLIGNLALMVDLTARTGPRPLTAAAGHATRLVLLAMPLAIVFFLFFPRLEAPLWSFGRDDQTGITGLSDELEPGSITQLVLSGELAFRVWFDGPAPAPERLYWRGPVLWHMDGRRWTGEPIPRFDAAPQPLALAEDQVSYRVVLEPNNQRWLLALDKPVLIPDGATWTADFQVLASRRVTTTERYQMTSAMQYDTGQLDPAMAAAAAQLPPNVTARMRALVDHWRRDATSDRDLVERGLAYFRDEEFHYTLEPPPLGPNPTDEFLFETRRGFCEHYASAFAVLMRLAGIPARVVLGYHGGEQNPMGGYHIIWQSDAHAWTEVWLAGEGWQRIDPTAAIAAHRIERGSLVDGLGATRPIRFAQQDLDRLAWLAHRMRLAGDALRAGWQDWVLDYSTARQLALLSLIGLGFMSHYGLAVVMVLAAAVALALTVALVARTRRDPLEVLYDRFCGRLARIGLTRQPNEGPVAFYERISARRPDLGPLVEPFLSLYIRIRYGHGATIDDRRELARRLKRLNIRKGRSGGRDGRGAAVKQARSRH
ncbi:DUF3488 and transglutaminase-like domain-containing protein [Thioalkalicoccus limnaeus]|uniref:DUF3488 and transglutaminase-like domain-containing protein n=1 Tax=Thioalkalicoccus limnaeus TaxID=120681 RepID=A0ABV4BGU0_9GAMM